MAKKKMTPKKSTSKKSVQKSTQKLGGNPFTWPQQVLFRPDRLKYVRHLEREPGCVFCKAASGQPQFSTLCVYQSEYSMIVMNKFPYNSGHLLVLPRRHQGDYLGLTEHEHTDLHLTLQKAIKALKSLYQPLGFNVGLNLGAAAGAGLPDHLHFHVIPRWSSDLNFFPLVSGTKVVVESLEQTFDRLLGYFNQR